MRLYNKVYAFKYIVSNFLRLKSKENRRWFGVLDFFINLSLLIRGLTRYFNGIKL